jgi:O-antigen/teichoic acid export membrane protein
MSVLALRVNQAYSNIPALLHSIFLVSCLRVGGILLAFITSIILARALSPSGYGAYAFVFSIISLLTLPVSAGLPDLLVRQVADYHHDNKMGLMAGLIKRSHQVVCWISILVMLILIVVSYNITDWTLDDKWMLLIAASPLIFITGIKGLRTGILQGLHKFKASQIPETVVRPFVFLVSLCILLMAESLNILSALLAQVLAVTISLVVGIWLLNKNLPQKLLSFTPEYENKNWLKSLIPFVQMSFVGTFNAQIVTLFLGLVTTDADVGVYRVASLVSGTLSIVYSVTSMALMPKIVMCYKNKDIEKLQYLLTFGAKVSFFSSLAMGSILILVGKELLLILFGSAYQAAYTAMVCMAVGQIVNAGLGLSGQLLNMTGNEKYTLKSQVLGLISITAFSAFLIPSYGATGGAIATAAGLILWNLFLYVKAWQVVKIDTCFINLFNR